MYLTTLLEDYLLEAKLRNLSTRTIKSAKNTNLLFFNWLRSEFGIEEIQQVKKPHIKAYLKYKQDQGLSPVYINSILRYLRMFFRYLVEEEYIDVNPIASVKFLIEEKVLVQSFSPEEVEKMIKVYSTDTFHKCKQYPQHFLHNRHFFKIVESTEKKPASLCTDGARLFVRSYCRSVFPSAPGYNSPSRSPSRYPFQKVIMCQMQQKARLADVRNEHELPFLILLYYSRK